MDKITTIKLSAESILTGNTEAAKNVINKEYPFKKLKLEGRSYTDKEKYEQFVRDGFIDRYSGEKLVNPGLLKVLSFYMPDTFPYQSHWKMEECHSAYWELVPTIDHIVPIALGGEDNPSNYATTSMLHNSVKSNWTIVNERDNSMHIYVDADACPVIGIVERIAKSHNIAVTLLCDTNHYLTSDYSEVVYVGAGADAVDFKLISLCKKGDLVVTQDYGVAAMALSKGAYAIHQSGKWYTNENIDLMLMERHISKKARRASSKNHMKGPRKRSDKDDLNFEASFERLVEKLLQENAGKD